MKKPASRAFFMPARLGNNPVLETRLKINRTDKGQQ
jgi:hypothetical protein